MSVHELGVVGLGRMGGGLALDALQKVGEAPEDVRHG
jgi:hypothetical protein